MSRIIAVYLVFDGVRCWNISDEDIAKLAAALPEFVVRKVTTLEDFFALLEVAEIAVTWRFPDEWVDRFPTVKIIATPAAGADLMPKNPGLGVKVIQGTFHGKIMAETAVGMMLDHARRLSEANNRMKEGEVWPRGELDKRLCRLCGSHVAILGFGAIGQFTAKYLKVFGCRITGIKQTVIPNPSYFDEDDRIISIADFKWILPSVDHLLIILPATTQTNDIINCEIFKALPSHAGVYNIGRGNCIIEEDIIDAINSGEILGAYLDVFQEEPLPVDSPLRSVDNIHVFPHSAAMAPEYLSLYIEELPEKIISVLEDS